MESMTTTCPHCTNSFQVAESRLGRGVRCPWCEERFQLSVEVIGEELNPEELGGWYCLGLQGEKMGPMNLAELIQMKEAETIKASSQIWREGWPKWRYADRLFRSLLPEDQTTPPTIDVHVDSTRPTRSTTSSPAPSVEQAKRTVSELTDLAGELQQLRTALIGVASVMGTASLAFVVWALLIGNIWGLAAAVSAAVFMLVAFWLRGHSRTLLRALKAYIGSAEPAAGIDTASRTRELLVAIKWSILLLAALLIASGAAVLLS